MKKRKPAYFGCEGNHEYRIRRAIKVDPRLEGDRYGISFSHLQTDHWFDEYYEYRNNAPDSFDKDGVTYAHYISNGNYGTAMRGMFFKDDAHPNPAIGLVAGCFKGAEESWAGQANHEWWKGVIIKRDIRGGCYDPEFVSMSRLKAIYG